jgi:hypothetical protein
MIIIFFLKGAFTYQFNTLGTYYYWSGFVDSNQMISFRGVIKVGVSVDVTLPVHVTVAGFKGNLFKFSCIY